MSVFDEFLTEEAGHLSVIQRLLMLIKLRQDSAKLQVTLAQVPQLEQLARDVKFLRRLNHILHLLLLSLRFILLTLIVMLLRERRGLVVVVVVGVLELKHLLDHRLVVVEVCHLGLQVVDRTVQVASTVLEHAQSVKGKDIISDKINLSTFGMCIPDYRV